MADNQDHTESVHVDLWSITIGDHTLHIQPSFIWLGIEFIVMIVFIVLLKKFKRSKVATLFDAAYEAMFDFFENILGEDEKYWIKSFVVGIFFIIVFSNLLGIWLEIIIPMFGKDIAGAYALHHYIQIPSSDINFNVAMAVVSILIMLFVQRSHGTHMHLSVHKKERIKYGVAGGIYLAIIWWIVGSITWYTDIVRMLAGTVVGLGIGIWWALTGLFGDKILWTIHFIHDYVSVTGKDILSIDRSAVENPIVFGVLRWLIKLFDIAISVFIWALEIVWLLAKIISLSYRLFGNMIAWGILLGILFTAVGGATSSRLGGREMPIIAPIIIYLQEILIALIQALVFPLLVAIFIRVAQATD